MDTRTDFVRLLEEMDKVLDNKKRELVELDERLDGARDQLSEKEAKELRQEEQLNDKLTSWPTASTSRDGELKSCLSEQKKLYDQQLAKFNEELTELESMNQELTNENRHLRDELKSVQQNYDKINTESRVMAESLDEVKQANFELNLRLARAESELVTQQKLLKKTQEEDEILMNALDAKLDSLKKAIAAKDEEIKQLRSCTQFTLESLGISSSDHLGSLETSYMSENLPTNIDERRGIIEIAAAIRDKDAQISSLKNRLSEATAELEKSTSLLETLTNRPNQQSGNDADNRPNLNEQLNDLISRCNSLEQELEVKDQQLTSVEAKNYQLEKVMPDLIVNLLQDLDRKTVINSPDRDELIRFLSGQLGRLLNEMNSTIELIEKTSQLEILVKAKDAHIERLVSELNYIDINRAMREHPMDAQAEFDTIDVEISASIRDGFTNQNKKISNVTEDGKSQISKLDQAVPAMVEEHVSQESAENSHSKPDTCSPDLDSQMVLSDESEKSTQKQDEKSTGVEASEQPDASDQSVASFRSVASDHSAASEQSAVPEQPATIEQSVAPEQSLVAKQPLVSKRPEISKQIVGPELAASSANVAVPKQSTRKYSDTIDDNVARIDTLLSLQRRLGQIENENELLELAMKEILLSIKWSDSQCNTILIDCPSLERLCQLIEARFIAQQSSALSSSCTQQQADRKQQTQTQENSGASDESFRLNSVDLFQFILLKSELDLLRGQNEQLRADVKIYRRECQEFLNNSNEDTATLPSTRLLSIRSNAKLGSVIDNADSSPRCRQKTHHTKSEGKPDFREILGQSSDRHGSPSVSMGRDAECQTEMTLDAFSNTVERVRSPTRLVDKRCKNCARSANLINHLLQSLARIETRLIIQMVLSLS